MSLHDLRKDVWEGLRAAPGRHLLALFAMFIGLTILTLGLALVHGLDQRAARIESDFGAQSFALPRFGEKPLQTSHADIVRANLPGGLVVPIRAEPDAKVAGIPGVDVTATSPDLAALKNWRLREGRFLDEHDMQVRARVAVLSSSLWRRTGKKIGDGLNVGRDFFVVVGIVETGGTPEEGVWATSGDRVFIPHTTPGSWHSAPDALLQADAILARPAEGQSLDQGIQAARNALAGPPDFLTGFEPITASSLTQKARELRTAIVWSVWGMAGLSILLGGAVLGSLMAAAVASRVPEIGLRRAIGATPGDIVALFIGEGLAICGVAILLAGAVSGGLLLFLDSQLPVPVATRSWIFLVPLLVALATGVLATSAPALRAARIAPAEALRAE